ncbi:MAG: hypothetical protein JRJ19_08190 [Deltaproteobacteria bacterium]|nr:hypothetical protein [Deltaproteobacteria bacterium]
MALELKIESLRSRGELTADERDRLVNALGENHPPERKPAFVTPLRTFLLGVIAGIVIAYVTWGFLS